jgi:signal transduction histidine kinase
VSSKALSTEDSNYKPEVFVTVATSTLQRGSRRVEIRVNDNGPGITDEIKDKIFQPFFTTKPTGEGTGLGLSLSYDIITKGHGGEIKVESNAEKGTEFIVQLPIN